MSKRNRNLSLNRETVRELSRPEELAEAAGGTVTTSKVCPIVETQTYCWSLIWVYPYTGCLPPHP